MPARRSPKPKTPPPAPPPVVKRPAHRPPYVATDKDRVMVKVMVAGGIDQLSIAGVLGISHVTLRKYFRREIATAAAEVGAQVVSSLITMAIGQKPAPGRPAVAPNFHAAKWYTQARMGWSEHIVVVDDKPADIPMRVIVELVGEAAPPRVEQPAPRAGSRLSDSARVQLVG